MMFRVDGTQEEVSIGRTIGDARKWYKTNAISCVEEDLADIHMYYREESSDIEYVTCIYDCAASASERLMRNKGIPMAICLGDVLVFKTVVPESFSGAMADEIQDMNISVDFIHEHMRRFRDKLEGMNCTISTTTLVDAMGNVTRGRQMFPFILTTYARSRFSYEEFKPAKSGKVGADTDLLTWRPKLRGFQIHGFPLFMGEKASKQLVKKMSQKPRFCLSCKGAVHLHCSRCKKHYWCGSEECKKQAWGKHKAGCKA